MKAIPCRLQNDSPPHSLNGTNSDKNAYGSDAAASPIEAPAVCARAAHTTDTVTKLARTPTELAYVNLNRIVEDECDVLGNELQGGQAATANGALHRSVDTNLAYYGSESENSNAYDNTNASNNTGNGNKLSNFYVQATPPPPPPPLPPPPLIAWHNSGDNCAAKPIVSPPNQKTINHLSNSTAPANALYADNGNGNTPTNNNEHANMAAMHSGDNNINSHMNANNKNTFAHCTNNAVHGKHFAHYINIPIDSDHAMHSFFFALSPFSVFLLLAPAQAISMIVALWFFFAFGFCFLSAVAHAQRAVPWCCMRPEFRPK